MAGQQLKLSSDAAIKSAVERAAQVLADGGLAVVPTETVYGVLARLDHPAALIRLRQLRGNGAKAMTVHVASATAARDYLDPLNAFQAKLLKRLWPGPVSMVFGVAPRRQAEVAKAKSVEVADLYDNGLITLRCPSHPAAGEVLERCPHPIAGLPPGPDATRFDAIPKEALDAVDISLDGGPTAQRKASTVIRVSTATFDIIRPGVYDRRIIEKMLQTTILFVCSGNTCRSPMAEAIARKVLSDALKVPESELPAAGYHVISAGASAFGGAPASTHAVAAVKEFGADLSKHRSRALTPQLIAQANVIFAMGRGHAEAIRMIDPTATKKVALLDVEGDIEDPIGGELGLYQKLAGKMKTLIERRLADESLLGLEKSI